MLDMRNGAGKAPLPNNPRSFARRILFHKLRHVLRMYHVMMRKPFIKVVRAIELRR